ncbi:DUF3515 domain-containing protein [Actinotalea sp. K2]|uniref:DUF3515 domain-containing protein n=1 Tax=Actinotalea sp. K2 TaxID=2939438 RepID=UPI002016D3AD|nr:DUF3515 domain-containing protein [Actinotalea sp. K2]MCL3860534.1 DUF3515 domain-containing protein [Actinotalea sp. K2]
MPSPEPRPGRLRVGLLLCVAGLSGCSGTVVVEPGPFAADPRCAEVVLALPQTLAGGERLATSSQATVAWGDPTDPVVLRCGVEPPGPTTDDCVTADDGVTSVDWLAVPGAQEPDGGTAWTFTTYGRVPAVEVQVPASVTADRSTAFLMDLGPAVSRVEQDRRCL